MNAFAFGLAFLLDLVIGDPRSWPHPVRLIGRLISSLTALSRSIAATPEQLRAAGVLIVIVVVGLTWWSAWLATSGLSRYSPALAWIIALYLAYASLAVRSLYEETRRVVLALEEDDLPRARRLLGLVVGRETDDLDRPGIIRALLETISENLSDGVTTPLFYLALGGPPLALAYKAVSTLDSMIGYKDERFRHLGWAAARLDDLANFIPARLTAAFICLSCFILRLDARAAFLTWLTDGPKHPSPNAGRPEAALAGALGVRLGGPAVYNGQVTVKPYLGAARAALNENHVFLAHQVLFLVSGMMGLAGLIGRALW